MHPLTCPRFQHHSSSSASLFSSRNLGWSRVGAQGNPLPGWLAWVSWGLCAYSTFQPSGAVAIAGSLLFCGMRTKFVAGWQPIDNEGLKTRMRPMGALLRAAWRSAIYRTGGANHLSRCWNGYESHFAQGTYAPIEAPGSRGCPAPRVRIASSLVTQHG
jgi:hypothetical protein